MADHKLFSELKQILADLYVEPADAKRVAADAGLDLTRIPFGATAINSWHNILAVALTAAALDPLLATALDSLNSPPLSIPPPTPPES